MKYPTSIRFAFRRRVAELAGRRRRTVPSRGGRTAARRLALICSRRDDAARAAGSLSRSAVGHRSLELLEHRVAAALVRAATRFHRSVGSSADVRRLRSTAGNSRRVGCAAAVVRCGSGCGDSTAIELGSERAVQPVESALRRRSQATAGGGSAFSVCGDLPSAAASDGSVGLRFAAGDAGCAGGSLPFRAVRRRASPGRRDRRAGRFARSPFRRACGRAC